MPIPQEIARIASSLILRNSSPENSLTHFSVKEYLITERVESSFSAQLAEIEARASIIRVCLVYMNHLGSSGTAEEICTYFSLAIHAAESWMKHARHAESRQVQ